MNDRRTPISVPALAAAIVVTLLLLAGVYTAAAGPAPREIVEPTSPDIANSPTAYSSGWQPIAVGTTRVFTHSLGLLNPGLTPEQLAVELWFKDTAPGGIGINRANYGGMEYLGNLHGAYWYNLTPNTIQVHRLPNDNAADQINVKVWVVPPPDYDSGWQNIAPGTTLTFHHNQGVAPENLNVSLWFSGTVSGINHFAYGGLTHGSAELGAYWFQLTNNTVSVYRRPDDLTTEQVRVVVLQPDSPPAYDSLVALGGWQNIAQGQEFTFTHNLNWNPDMLLVRGECYDPATNGINQMFAGGDHWAGGFRGGHLQNLTANSVTFVRRANDVTCPQARVVIYKRAVRLYLPLVLSNYTSP